MAELNFSIAPQNPLPGMMQALQFGQMIGGIRDQRALAEQQAQAAAEAARQKAERDAQIAAGLKLVHESPTAENYANVSNLLPPEQAKAMQSSFAMLEKSKQQEVLNESAQVYAAFKSDNTDIALDILQRRADAYRNSGDEEGAKRTQALIDIAKVGPMGKQTIEDMFGLTISMMPGGKEAIEGVAKFAEERRNEEAEPTARKKALADLGLTEAQINETIARTNKLNAEIIKMNDDLAVAKVSGGLDPEKKFNSELSLNKEYTARTKAYDESLRLNDVIKTSAASATGAGDLALINTFMKMLDPGSVVRESEFAQAQDTAGLVSKLAASLGRVKNGEVLVPAQRAEFAKLANEYMQAATKNEEKVRSGINYMVKSYGLNPENVFGTMANETTKKPNSEPDPATIQTAPSATVKQPTIKVDY